MPTYRYRALDRAGALTTGTLEAASSEAALKQLRGEGRFPISAEPAEAGGLWGLLTRDFELLPKDHRREIAFVAEELAVLLSAGLPMERSIALILKMGEARGLSDHLEQVLKEVRDGASFADALARQSVFPPFFVALVRAGEAGGRLADALKEAAAYLERSRALRESVISALTYPALLLIAAAGSTLFLLVFVFPSFEVLFENGDVVPPLPARLAFFASHAIRDHWLLWLALLVCVIAGGVWALRSERVRPALDRRLLTLSLVGPLLRQMEGERFARTLGTLVTRGVSVPEALRISEGALSNRHLRSGVMAAATGVRQGASLGHELTRLGGFPPALADLARIGEESGELGPMLVRYAELAERSLRHTLDRGVALLVPVTTLVLGVLIGGLIAAMLSAVLSVNEIALQGL